MFRLTFSNFIPLLGLTLLSACANIIPPTGGPKDVKAPKLISISPKDSMLNTKVSRIEMKFDEWISATDVTKELHISPAITPSPTMTVSGKTVIIKIADSLLQTNTTYTVNVGKAIKDLHEGNPFIGKPFTFSTGSWFDSLTLKGNVVDAQSGLRDSSATVKVMLYDAQQPYDIVTKQKPAYVVVANNRGEFQFTGLPSKAFRLFALKENSENLLFDNDEELIAFTDTIFNPSIDTTAISLSIFKELPDTSRTKTEVRSDEKFGKRSKSSSTIAENDITLDTKTFNYKVLVDTNNSSKRTQEINQTLDIHFSHKIEKINQQRILISSDSNGIEVECKWTYRIDSSKKKVQIALQWIPNTLYTLRLQKGFTQDSSNTDAMPSKYIFRTKSEEDYGKLEVNIPKQFQNKQYLLQLQRNADIIYTESVVGSKKEIKLLSAGNYKIILIEDINNDKQWTTGELKKKRQPEKVIPYPNAVLIKAGWEHLVDFEK
jgi:hypothetical protein